MFCIDHNKLSLFLKLLSDRMQFLAINLKKQYSGTARTICCYFLVNLPKFTGVQTALEFVSCCLIHYPKNKNHECQLSCITSHSMEWPSVSWTGMYLLTLSLPQQTTFTEHVALFPFHHDNDPFPLLRWHLKKKKENEMALLTTQHRLHDMKEDKSL